MLRKIYKWFYEEGGVFVSSFVGVALVILGVIILISNGHDDTD
jgi:hypothetical protein